MPTEERQLIDYRDVGTCLATANPKSRTVSGEFQGQRIWFKHAVPPKARIWHVLQRLCASLLRQPIMRATVSEGGAHNLHAEAARLRLFKSSGFHVPDVLAVYDDMLVMTDAGPQLRQYLDALTDTDTRLSVLKKAIRSLSSLHQAGLAHGRPYMRDMTWDGIRIGFLDLEEDPALVMPIADAQARDIWIFLGAASRYARRPGKNSLYDDSFITILLDHYAKDADAKVMRRLSGFAAYLSPVRRLLDRPFLWNKIGTDARQAVVVNRCLEGYSGPSSFSSTSGE